MAAKFSATIVPFAAIGADEAVTTHLNGDELERLQKLLPQPPQLPFDLPFLPKRKPQMSVEERRARIPRARVGVNATPDDLEAFMSVSIRLPAHGGARVIGGVGRGVFWVGGKGGRRA